MRCGKFLLPTIGITFIFSVSIFPFPTFAALEDGLVAHYPLDGDVLDFGGSAHNGAAFGATLTADRDGNPDSAYAFNGVNNFLQIPHFDALNMTRNGFAVSYYVRVHPQQFSPDGLYSVLDKFHGFGCDGTATGWTFQGHTSSGLSFVYGDNVNYNGIAGPSISNDQWHHVIGMVSDSQFIFYVDGTLVRAQNLPNDPVGNTSPLFIGKWACGNSRFFHGAVDDIRIYDRNLTNEEIVVLSELTTTEPPVDPAPPVDPSSLRPATNTDLVIQSVSIDPVTGEVSIKATLDSSSTAWSDINSNPDIRLTVEVQSNDGTEAVGIIGDSSVQLLTDEQSNKLSFGDIEPVACEVKEEDDKKHKHGKHGKHHKHKSHHSSVNHKKHNADKWWEEQIKKARHQ